jgi:hypothetical protein
VTRPQLLTLNKSSSTVALRATGAGDNAKALPKAVKPEGHLHMLVGP